MSAEVATRVIRFTTTELIALGRQAALDAGFSSDLLDGVSEVPDCGGDVLQSEVGLLGVRAVDSGVGSIDRRVGCCYCFSGAHESSPSVVAPVIQAPDASKATLGDAVGSGSPSSESAAPSGSPE